MELACVAGQQQPLHLEKLLGCLKSSWSGATVSSVDLSRSIRRRWPSSVLFSPGIINDIIFAAVLITNSSSSGEGVHAKDMMMMVVVAAVMVMGPPLLPLLDGQSVKSTAKAGWPFSALRSRTTHVCT